MSAVRNDQWRTHQSWLSSKVTQYVVARCRYYSPAAGEHDEVAIKFAARAHQTSPRSNKGKKKGKKAAEPLEEAAAESPAMDDDKGSSMREERRAAKGDDAGELSTADKAIDLEKYLLSGENVSEEEMEAATLLQRNVRCFLEQVRYRRWWMYHHLQNDRGVFTRILNKPPDRRKMQHLMTLCTLLHTSEFFMEMERKVLLSVCRYFTCCALEPGEVLFYEGDRGDAVYVILEGKLGIYRKGFASRAQLAEKESRHGDKVAELGKGVCLGELALIRSQARAATVVGETYCVLMALSKDAFERLLKNDHKKYMDAKVEVLGKSSVFKDVSNATLCRLSYYFGNCRFGKNQVIMRQGQAVNHLYYIKRGRLGVYYNQHYVGANDAAAAGKNAPLAGRAENRAAVGPFSGMGSDGAFAPKCEMAGLGFQSQTIRKGSIAVINEGQFLGDVAVLVAEACGGRQPFTIVSETSLLALKIRKDDVLERLPASCREKMRVHAKLKLRHRARSLDKNKLCFKTVSTMNKPVVLSGRVQKKLRGDVINLRGGGSFKLPSAFHSLSYAAKSSPAALPPFRRSLSQPNSLTRGSATAGTGAVATRGRGSTRPNDFFTGRKAGAPTRDGRAEDHLRLKRWEYASSESVASPALSRGARRKTRKPHHVSSAGISSVTIPPTDPLKSLLKSPWPKSAVNIEHARHQGSLLHSSLGVQMPALQGATSYRAAPHCKASGVSSGDT